MRLQQDDQGKIVHITIICRSCNLDDLNNSTKISQMLLDAAEAADMKAVALKMHQFKPYGVTGFVLLAESHLAIHTWPERGLAVIDLLTCKPTKVERALNLIKKRLSSPKVEYDEKVIKK